MKLTDNQERVLATLRTHMPQGASIADLGKTKDRAGAVMGDAARKVALRLANRKDPLVALDGQKKLYALTTLGLGTIDELRPPSSPERRHRGYRVLREFDLDTLIAGAESGDVGAGATVFLVVGSFESRNAEHAFRQGAKQLAEDGEQGSIELCTVSDSHLHRETVILETDTRISFAA